MNFLQKLESLKSAFPLKQKPQRGSHSHIFIILWKPALLINKAKVKISPKNKYNSSVNMVLKLNAENEGKGERKVDKIHLIKVKK